MDSVAIAYLVVFLAGFSFLVITFLLGAAGGDAGHGEVGHGDLGHGDLGHGDMGSDGAAAADHSMSPGVFSFRVIACFLVGFGAAALVSHYGVTGPSPGSAKFPIDLGFGLAGGFLVGWCGWRIVKFFLSQQGFVPLYSAEFVGVVAPLTVGIREGGTGELTCNIKGKRVSLDVRTENGGALLAGTSVIVVSVSGSVGMVREA